jgi:hypothetical protein
MGLYAKARKIISAQEKDEQIMSPVIDYSPRAEQEHGSALPDAIIDPLITQIKSDIDQDSRFIILKLSIGKIIDGIRQSAPDSAKENIASEIFSFVKKATSYIAHPYRVTNDNLLLVVQTADSVDLELLVHQIYVSLSNSFVGFPDENCLIFNSKARIYPQDGNDVRKLVCDII